MTAQSTRTAVDTIVTHKDPHLDECVAVAILREVLGDLRVVCIHDDEITKFDPRTTVFVGIGGGDLDEHKHEGRLHGTCAAALVAEALGLHDHPHFQVLLAETLRADTERGQSHLEWGNLVKVLHRYGEGVDEDWVVRFIDLVVQHHLAEQRGDTPLREPADLLVDWEIVHGSEDKIKPLVGTIVLPSYAPAETLLKAWMVKVLGSRRWRAQARPNVVFVSSQEGLDEYKDRYDTIFVGIEGGQFPPEMTVQEVARYFGASNKKDPKMRKRMNILLQEIGKDPVHRKPFDFATIIDRTNKYSDLRPETLFMIACKIMDSYERKAVEFHETCPKEWSERGVLRNFGGYNVAFVETDTRSMEAYCRTIVKADVTVLRNRSGNVVIFTTEKTKDAFLHIAEQIAIAEANREDWSDGAIDDLERELKDIVEAGRGRNLPSPAEHWHAFLQNGTIMNGSLTHQAKPTCLSNRQISDAVERGLKMWANHD